jgi:hypothetical protein
LANKISINKIIKLIQKLTAVSYSNVSNIDVPSIRVIPSEVVGSSVGNLSRGFPK